MDRNTKWYLGLIWSGLWYLDPEHQDDLWEKNVIIRDKDGNEKEWCWNWYEEEGWHQHYYERKNES